MGADLMARVPRLHPEVGLQRVGDRLMAAGPDAQLHTFEEDSGQRSEVAERIVELCDGRRTVGEIVDALCEEFDVERARCAADTESFVQRLVERKVLVF